MGAGAYDTSTALIAVQSAHPFEHLCAFIGDLKGGAAKVWVEEERGGGCYRF